MMWGGWRYSSLYDGISLWTCGNILASSNTTSCLIICLLNVRNLIQTIHNMYTMSVWKHILSQKHQLTKELPCTGDQSALIVCCFELFPLSQLADRVYPIIPLPPGRGVGPPDRCLSLCPTKTSPDPDPVKTDIKYREILFDGLTCTKYLQHGNQYLLFPLTLMSLNLISVTEITSRISRNRFHEVHKIYFCSENNGVFFMSVWTIYKQMTPSYE